MGAPRLTDADDLLDDSRRFRLALAYDGKHHSALGPPERWRRRPARVASSRVCLGQQRPMGCPGGPCFLRKPRTSRRLLSRSRRPRRGRLLRRPSASRAARRASSDNAGPLTPALLLRQERGTRLGLTLASGADEIHASRRRRRRTGAMRPQPFQSSSASRSHQVDRDCRRWLDAQSRQEVSESSGFRSKSLQQSSSLIRLLRLVEGGGLIRQFIPPCWDAVCHPRLGRSRRHLHRLRVRRGSAVDLTCMPR
jgi:hypothetical protein